MKSFIVCAALMLVACGDAPESKEDNNPPPVSTSSITPYRPDPVPSTEDVRQCTATKTVQIKDCTLYFLTCDDGEPDMVLLCPPVYWEPGEYVPTPP